MINYLSNKFISICLEEKIIDVDSDIYTDLNLFYQVIYV